MSEWATSSVSWRQEPGPNLLSDLYTVALSPPKYAKEVEDGESRGKTWVVVVGGGGSECLKKRISGEG